jgi:hypothetical protein
MLSLSSEKNEIMLSFLKKITGGTIFLFCLIQGSQLSAQTLSTVTTSKEEKIAKRIKYFSIVEKTNNYVVAQTCKQTTDLAEMPQCFLMDRMISEKRTIEIHLLNSNLEDMVLEHNEAEDDVFFVKSKFVVNERTKSWHVLMDGYSVVFRNNESGMYLAINEEGDFYPASHVDKASRFELIHQF